MGVAIFQLVDELILRYTESTELVMGVILIAVVMFMPMGFMGLIQTVKSKMKARFAFKGRQGRKRHEYTRDQRFTTQFRPPESPVRRGPCRLPKASATRSSAPTGRGRPPCSIPLREPIFRPRGKCFSKGRTSPVIRRTSWRGSAWVDPFRLPAPLPI